MEKSLQLQVLEYLKDRNISGKFIDVKIPFASNLTNKDNKSEFKSSILYLKKHDMIEVSNNSNLPMLLAVRAGIPTSLKDITILCRITPKGEDYIKKEATPLPTFNIHNSPGSIIGDHSSSDFSNSHNAKTNAKIAPRINAPSKDGKSSMREIIILVIGGLLLAFTIMYLKGYFPNL